MRRAKLLCLVLGDEEGGGPEVLSLMGSIPLMREAIEEIRGGSLLLLKPQARSWRTGEWPIYLRKEVGNIQGNIGPVRLTSVVERFGGNSLR